MTTQPSGQAIYSPKIRDQALVRKFIAQNGRGYVAITIHDGTNAVDPDPGTLQIQVWFNDVTANYPTSDDPRGVLVVTGTADQISHTGTGSYYFDIGPEYTANRGILTAVWSYQIKGAGFTFVDNLQILNQMPLYDSLTPQEKSVVEQVSWMFGDLFDSTEGGPYLIEPFQTKFDYERLAQMEQLAIARFNITGFPVTPYQLGGGQDTLPSQFAGLIVFGTYLEVVRHLTDSYVEIPGFQAMNVTYADRRDYMQRWNEIYQREWPDYKEAVIRAKRSLLSLGRGSLLVGGGIFGGNATGVFQAGTYASQVRSWRFYPAAPAISWGSTSH